MKAKLLYCAVHDDCKHKNEAKTTHTQHAYNKIKKKNRIHEPIGNGHDVDTTFHAKEFQ